MWAPTEQVLIPDTNRIESNLFHTCLYGHGNFTARDLLASIPVGICWNNHLVSTMRSMIRHAPLPYFLSGEDIRHIRYKEHGNEHIIAVLY